MKRSSILLPFVLLAGLVASGCSHYPYDRPMRRLPDVYGDRSDRGSYRVDGDVRDYVRYMDRHLRLSSTQARRIDRILTERTYRFLDRNRSHDYDRYYPFPRRYYRDQTRNVRNWWEDTDNYLERLLNRDQRRAYRNLVRDDFHRQDRYYRDRDRRYDDRYDRDDYPYERYSRESRGNTTKSN